MCNERKNQCKNACLPRIMVAAPASGSGKTLVTCGLLQALQNRNIKTAAFKCGPDYIDPMFHARVIGVPSRNLDTFFADAQTTRYLFGRQAVNARLSVMEGVMGFYDGIAGITANASSWELASVTDTPVILVVNAHGMSLSVVPLMEGFLNFSKNQNDYDERNVKDKKDFCASGNVSVVANPQTGSMIRGVILNQIGDSIYQELKQAIESRLSIKVLGYVPHVPDCVLESRHLGLVTPDGISDLKDKLKRLADVLEETLDLDGILKLANGAPTLDISMPGNLVGLLGNNEFRDSEEARLGTSVPFARNVSGKEGRLDTLRRGESPVRIAIARDEAFCFYYEDNLELLRSLGAELVPFSPLYNTELPENIQGLLLGGGYPELYAEKLSGNVSMRDSVRARIACGLPYLAECGGFLYLQQSMEDMEKISWPMAGVFSGRAYKTERLNRFGYITLTPNVSDSVASEWLGGRNHCIRAHEFHYFDSTENGAAFHAQKPCRKKNWDCIMVGETYVAGFPHLYYYSNPDFAKHFLEVCRKYTPSL